VEDEVVEAVGPLVLKAMAGPRYEALDENAREGVDAIARTVTRSIAGKLMKYMFRPESSDVILGETELEIQVSDDFNYPGIKGGDGISVLIVSKLYGDCVAKIEKEHRTRLAVFDLDLAIKCIFVKHNKLNALNESEDLWVAVQKPPVPYTVPRMVASNPLIKGMRCGVVSEFLRHQ